MRSVLRLGQAKRRRVGDQDVELATGTNPLEAEPKLELQRAPAHLALRILVRPFLVANAAPEAGDSKPVHLDDPAVDVVASLRTRYGQLGTQRHPRHVPRLEAFVVVAGDVEERDVHAAHQVFEVVERQVTTGKDEVWLQGREPVTVQQLIDLVGDGEDARVAR